jgi:ribosomal protein S18 acetylase RimI-like enzyme
VDIQPISESLIDQVEAFLRRIPESDYNSFAEDVLAPRTAESWLSDSRGQRAVAVGPGERVDGYVAVIPLVGWSSHVGSLRLVVDPAERGRGTGRALARHGLLAGLHLGLSKIVVEVVADATPAIGMFEALGFRPEALLQDHVRDRAGGLRDLIVLSHLVDDTWSSLHTVGIADALT